jgi:hypothetical protein
MYGCMDVWMYGCMDVWMYGCMDVWMYVCMYVCLYVFYVHRVLLANVCLCIDSLPFNAVS